ncbi:hypothetical protein [Serinicoccus kebangsaanensis]|uniref:hypothetical protein n=1 Tax=Serinicoccus kebangsaanensis TaxID=2602069 RepID=UPI00124CC886|nr:hypothetical protein [Serinicoccus kebangsaanensis]
MSQDELRIKGLLGEPELGPWGLATFMVELSRWPTGVEVESLQRLAHRMTRADVRVPASDRSETPCLEVQRARARQLPQVVSELEDLLARVRADDPGRRRQRQRQRESQRENISSELHRLLGSDEQRPPSG